VERFHHRDARAHYEIFSLGGVAHDSRSEQHRRMTALALAWRFGGGCAGVKARLIRRGAAAQGSGPPKQKDRQEAVGLILANLGRDAEAKVAVFRPLVLEPDFFISEWAARIRQCRTGLLHVRVCHELNGAEPQRVGAVDEPLACLHPRHWFWVVETERDGMKRIHQ
jgi:hypothetical protein